MKNFLITFSAILAAAAVIFGAYAYTKNWEVKANQMTRELERIQRTALDSYRLIDSKDDNLGSFAFLSEQLHRKIKKANAHLESFAFTANKQPLLEAVESAQSDYEASVKILADLRKR